MQEALKLQMAAAAQQLLQNPQDHLKNLTALLALTTDSHPEVLECQPVLVHNEGGVPPNGLTFLFQRQMAPGLSLLQLCGPHGRLLRLAASLSVAARAKTSLARQRLVTCELAKVHNFVHHHRRGGLSCMIKVETCSGSSIGMHGGLGMAPS